MYKFTNCINFAVGNFQNDRKQRLKLSKRRRNTNKNWKSDKRRHNTDTQDTLY